MIAPLRRPRIAFAGGGTGGHLYPGLAVARALHGFEPVFLLPSDRGDGARLGAEFESHVVLAPRPDRDRMLYPARLLRAVVRTRRLLRELGAEAVVGLGGYASVPAALAARTLGLPLYLVECNAVPGKATRLLARFADGIGLGSEGALERLPARACRVTGTPLRQELRRPARAEEFGLVSGVGTLLVLGGSQGAQTLNSRVLEALPACEGLPFQVLHCAGERDAERVRAAYRSVPVRATVVDFLPDIGRAYCVADLVLSRGGASTVAECLALGRPAAIVPYPWHKDGQQRRNAEEAVRAGAARLIEEEELTSARMRELVAGLLLDPDALLPMALTALSLARPEAAQAMAQHLVESLDRPSGGATAVAELGE